LAGIGNTRKDVLKHGAGVMLQTFTTQRLIAEKLHQNHLDDLVRLHLDSDASRFLGGVRSPEVTKTYLETSIAHWDQYGFGLWALRTQDGLFAGRAGIRHILVEDAPEVEIAYTFRQEFWGQGFASEITGALVDIGFRHLSLSSLVGVVFTEHAASRRVLEKSGFVLEREVIFHGENCVLYRRKPVSSVG
jgi:RimJ/RimL family protein N-acetyltransferase